MEGVHPPPKLRRIRMLYLILTLTGIILLLISSFYIICYIVSLWSGCDNKEAMDKVRDFLNGNTRLKLEQDGNFVNDVWLTVKNVIGDERFNKLVL